MQSDHQYFKDNPIRKCPKCHQNVLAGGGECLRIQKYQPITHGHDPTATAYYVGDQAAGEYQAMFRDLFIPCLAKYPKGDTLAYKNGRIGPNTNKE